MRQPCTTCYRARGQGDVAENGGELAAPCRERRPPGWRPRGCGLADQSGHAAVVGRLIFRSALCTEQPFDCLLGIVGLANNVARSLSVSARLACSR